MASIRWGVISGLRLAVLFSAWVALLMLVSRSLIRKVGGIHPVNGLVVIASCVGGGIGGGIIVGLLRPLSRWAVGAALVGVLAAMPLAIALGFMLSNFARLSFTDMLSAIITALLLGPTTALYVRARSLGKP